MFKWAQEKLSGRHEPTKGTFEHCLWVMLSPSQKPLPNCTPTPALIGVKELLLNQHQIHRLCRSKKASHLLASFVSADVLPPLDKDHSGLQSVLWLYTLPTRFETLSFEEYMSHGAVPASSKRLYQGMSQQWDHTNPIINQLLQWYCLNRGQFELLVKSRAKAIIAPQNQWVSKDMSLALKQPHKVGSRGMAPLCDLPERSPRLLGHLVQDLWASIQQISAKPNVLGQRSLAIQHLQKSYKRAIFALLEKPTPDHKQQLHLAEKLIYVEPTVSVSQSTSRSSAKAEKTHPRIDIEV